MSNEYSPLKESFKRQIAEAQDEIAALRTKLSLIRELEKDLAKLERAAKAEKFLGPGHCAFCRSKSKLLYRDPVTKEAVCKSCRADLRKEDELERKPRTKKKEGDPAWDQVAGLLRKK